MIDTEEVDKISDGRSSQCIKQEWQSGSVRLWIKYTLYVTLITISIFQPTELTIPYDGFWKLVVTSHNHYSATALKLVAHVEAFIAKFIEAPTSTTVSLTSMDAHDTPWITICPIPGYNQPMVETQLADIFRNRIEFPVESLVNGVTTDYLKATLTASNETNLQSFLNEIMLPITSNYAVKSGKDYHEITTVLNGASRKASLIKHANDWRWYSVLGSSSVKKSITTKTTHSLFLGYTSYWKYQVNMSVEFEKRMTVNVTVGSLENSLVLHKDAKSLLLCTTIKLNVAMAPGPKDRIDVQLDSRASLLYKLRPSGSFREMVLRGEAITQLEVHMHQPWTSFNVYQPIATRAQASFTLKPGKYANILFGMEKYHRLDKSGDRCTDSFEEIQQASRCVTNCFETVLFEKNGFCRIPGYRESTTSLEFNWPISQHYCRTAEDYHSFPNKSIFNSKGREVLAMCESLCPRPCTHYVYKWKDVSMPPQSTVVTNFSDYVIPGKLPTRAKMFNFDIFARSPYKRTVEESFSFSFFQLLSELGGSWGLLLGASFHDLVQLIQLLANKLFLLQGLHFM